MCLRKGRVVLVGRSYSVFGVVRKLSWEDRWEEQ
jgi:hypothetical protein